MKRAIFRTENVEKNLKLLVFSTPISPEGLAFAPGEEMFVALPRHQVRDSGEYQFLYRVDNFDGEDRERAADLFGMPSWRFFYRLASVAAIEPFSLDDLVADAGERGPVIRERYRGQTQHHRIIRSIAAEDEPIFRNRLTIRPDPVVAADATLARNEADATVIRIGNLSRAEIVRRLLGMDSSNRTTGVAGHRQPSQRQARRDDFVSLIRALYDGRCQACGVRLAGPRDNAASQVHHLSPWDGTRSDTLANVICLCPNDHALFTLGALQWTGHALAAWEDGRWLERPLAIDYHLTQPLKASDTRA